MALNPVGLSSPTHANTVGMTPLVDLAFRAFQRCGKSQQDAAALLDTSKSNFSKAFSVNWDDNPFMKKWDKLPFEIRREFAALIAADYGITAADSEPVRVLRDLHRVLRAVGE